MRLLLQYDSAQAYYPQILSALLFTAVALYASFLELRVQKLKRRAKSDKRGLEDLLGLIHETERAITNSRELSTLAREYLRIRISRFGIGKNAWRS